jgi:hypothetical protein
MLDSEASPEFCRFASEPRTTRSKAARRSWVFPEFCPAFIVTLRTAAKPEQIPILIRREIGNPGERFRFECRRDHSWT